MTYIFYASMLDHYQDLLPLSRTDEERSFRAQQVRHYTRLFNQAKSQNQNPYVY